MGRPIRGTVAAAIVAALLAITPGAVFAAPTSLLVPQSTAFTILGHWCGGIWEKAYASGFDTSASHYPAGDVYLWTTCSHGSTYKAWVSTSWDFTGALISYTVLSQPPTVNPTLSVYDTHGNHLYNQSYRAYLALASGFVPASRVAGVSPASAPQGSTIVISGTSFTGATAVHFGSRAAAFTVSSDTSITSTAPAVRSGTVDVTVTNSGGTSPKVGSDQFTFTLAPRLARLNPNQGSADGGDSVTITGVNFTGTSAVYFGGAPAPTIRVVSDTTLAVITPAGPDSGITVDVWVTNSHGTSALTPADRFLYT